MFGRRLMWGRAACVFLIAACGVSASLQATAQAQTAPSSSRAQPDGVVSFDIPAQPLASALTEFARQSGQELLYSPDAAEGRTGNAVSGKLSRADAMAELLEGTGLEFLITTRGGMMIGEPSVVESYRNRIQKPAGERSQADASVQNALADGPAATDAAATTLSVETARREGIEEIIVTGQKKEERIQDVPIAISAFSMDQLDNQKIEGGFDLLKAIPNVTFSKSNFSGYNFQIRGIGTQAISATTDPGVAVSFNNTTLIINRLFEQEYLDIERVEVLRGPQGTLYGRNATAGVVNVISAKPEMGVYSGEMKLETGNYGAQRFRGHVNVPLGDDNTLAARMAFAMTKREGYGTNLAEGQSFAGRDPMTGNIDDRDLWTGRFSLGWQPTDRFRANLIYERFEEDDSRMRSTKQLCHHADGEVMLYKTEFDGDGNPVSVPVPFRDAVPAGQSETNIQTRFASQLTQGCLPKSLFDKGNPRNGDNGAYGTPNGNAIPFVRAGRGGSFSLGSSEVPFPGNPGCISSTLVSNCVLDPLATTGGQSRDLRSIFSLIEPRYQAMSELLELSFDYELSDGLTVSSQTVYNSNDLFSTQDFLRYQTLQMFGNSLSAAGVHAYKRGVVPNGIFNDPQLGPSDRLLMQDVSQLDATQFSQEFRLVSKLDGPFNFSVGANYTRFETVTDYFVFINALTALARTGNVYSGVPTEYHFRPDDPGFLGLWGIPGSGTMTVGCGDRFAQIEEDISGNKVANCIYIQQGSIDEVRSNPQGHNFFMSRNPYALNAASVFGEAYYEFSPTLKLTAGLRLNWDRKTFTPVPSQTLLADWRGRLEGGTLFDSPERLPANADLSALCDPRVNGGNFGFVVGQVPCALGGLAAYGRGYPEMPDIVQEWRVPTGRIGLDWKADLGLGWVDETLIYGFYTRGYKAGGANPPVQSAPSGLLLAAAQGAAAPPVFKAEYVNALELGTKNRLLGGAVTLNATAFYYDYTDYQISKIVDRTAVNENVDATVWGLELETMFAPTPDTLLNASIGFLKTRIDDGEQSLDLMNRTQGGNRTYVDPSWASVDCSAGSGNENKYACLYPNGFDQWVLVRPTITQASSCIAPAVLVYEEFQKATISTLAEDALSLFCPGGRLIYVPSDVLERGYSPFTSAPNGSAGFLADVGGNELPNAPRFTVSLGAQQTYWLPGGNWSATGRVDWYWQDKSYHRIYNTEYDRLQDWTNTNLSLWVSNDRIGITVEAYVKNVFNESPITGAFLNSDDTGLSTNVFTLDPRLIGLSIRKRF